MSNTSPIGSLSFLRGPEHPKLDAELPTVVYSTPMSATTPRKISSAAGQKQLPLPPPDQGPDRYRAHRESVLHEHDEQRPLASADDGLTGASGANHRADGGRRRRRNGMAPAGLGTGRAWRRLGLEQAEAWSQHVASLHTGLA
jgi:hypothetical protein